MYSSTSTLNWYCWIFWMFGKVDDGSYKYPLPIHSRKSPKAGEKGHLPKTDQHLILLSFCVKVRKNRPVCLRISIS